MTDFFTTRTGILAMILTAFLWSIAGLFIKIIDWNPIAIAGLRSLIASIVLILYVKRPKFTFSFAQISAAITSTLTMLLFVSANKTTSSANAILLQYFAPVLTVFVGTWLIKERARPEHYISLLFITGGMIVMFFDRLGGGKLLGNILALISAFTLSLYFVFMRMQKGSSPVESIILAHWFTAAICGVISIFLPVPKFTLSSIISVTVLGVLQVGITGILFAFAIKRISAVQANLIGVIEPVCNPVWVFLVLGTVPGITTIIGGLTIIIAVTIVSIIDARVTANELS